MEDFLVAEILEQLFKTFFRGFYKDHQCLIEVHGCYFRTVRPRWQKYNF